MSNPLARQNSGRNFPQASAPPASSMQMSFRQSAGLGMIHSPCEPQSQVKQPAVALPVGLPEQLAEAVNLQPGNSELAAAINLVPADTYTYENGNDSLFVSKQEIKITHRRGILCWKWDNVIKIIPSRVKSISLDKEHVNPQEMFYLNLLVILNVLALFYGIYCYLNQSKTIAYGLFGVLAVLAFHLIVKYMSRALCIGIDVNATEIYYVSCSWSASVSVLQKVHEILTVINSNRSN